MEMHQLELGRDFKPNCRAKRSALQFRSGESTASIRFKEESVAVEGVSSETEHIQFDLHPEKSCGFGIDVEPVWTFEIQPFITKKVSLLESALHIKAPGKFLPDQIMTKFKAKKCFIDVA